MAVVRTGLHLTYFQSNLDRSVHWATFCEEVVSRRLRVLSCKCQSQGQDSILTCCVKVGQARLVLSYLCFSG